MNISKITIALHCLSLGILNNISGQQSILFDVKIKPGNAIVCLADNSSTALSSAKDILIVNNGAGIVGKTLKGHSGSVLDLNTNPSGDLLISGSKDNTAIIWNIALGQQIQALNGHKKPVIQTHFIDDRHAATISEDNTLKVWDVGSGDLVSTFSDHKKSLTASAVNQDYLITGDNQGNLVVRKAKTDSIVNRITIDGQITSMDLNPSGDIVFVGLRSGDIRAIDPVSGEIVSHIDNGNGSINNLSVTNDNHHLIVSSRDVRVYNLKSFLLVKEVDQVSAGILDAKITPDGENLYFIEEFAPRVQCLDVSDLNIAYAVNLKDENDKLPPQIYLSSPAKLIDNRVVQYDYLLRMSGSVIDDYGIQTLKVNGVETPVKQNGNFVINLPLTMGDNIISMEVTDLNQNTALKKFIVTRKSLEGSEVYDPSEAKNYLLVIGINKYEHWPQLFNAVKDANDVVSTLMSMYNFEFSDITLITDEQATRSNLYNKLREFVNLVGPKDNFMIYYSGHGHFDEVLNEGYWVPSDARLYQTGDYLSNSDISKIIGNINSQHTFLVADACYSGSLFNDTSRGYAENVEKYKSRWGLASGRLETVSDGDIGNNSPFARTFISYLKENTDEKIAVSQLVQHVKVQVAEMSDQTPIGNPLRGVGDEGGEFIFYKKD